MLSISLDPLSAAGINRLVNWKSQMLKEVGRSVLLTWLVGTLYQNKGSRTPCTVRPGIFDMSTPVGWSTFLTGPSHKAS